MPSKVVRRSKVDGHKLDIDRWRARVKENNVEYFLGYCQDRHTAEKLEEAFRAGK